MSTTTTTKNDPRDLKEESIIEGDVGLLAVDEMPLPMESQISLEQFASETALFPPPEDVNGEEIAGHVEEVRTPDKHSGGDHGGLATEGWYKRYTRWVPTSTVLLEKAERDVLSYVKTRYEGYYVDITEKAEEKGEGQRKCRWSSLWGGGPQERKMWTLEFNKESKNTPLVVIHGLCASVGLWALNIDELAKERPLYLIDLIGFGRSSRPQFSKDPVEAERQHVEAIEAWRKEVGLEQFILLGHSMGGFISTSYALSYPERVKWLTCVDPWGFPHKPDQVDQVLPVNRSLTLKAVTTIGQVINPLALVRLTGPFGQKLFTKARPDLIQKFEALNQDGKASVAEYIYHSNAQNPTGEEAFRTMMDFFGWAKNPIHARLHELKADLPLTIIYGGQSWLKQIPEATIKEIKPQNTEIHVVEGAGHHVYADKQGAFNSLVNKAGAMADKLLRPVTVTSNKESVPPVAS